jgi:hypothetical protein
MDWDVGEVAAHTSPLGSPLLTLGAPSLNKLVRPPPLGICLLCYIFEHPPIARVSWSSWKNHLCIIVIVLSFYIGIKKGFGGKLGVDLMCGCSLSCTNL